MIFVEFRCMDILLVEFNLNSTQLHIRDCNKKSFRVAHKHLDLNLEKIDEILGGYTEVNILVL